MNNIRTHREKIADPLTISKSWDDTLWYEKVSKKCHHKWHPVSIEPNTENNRCYLVCLKCCAYTYIETAFVGYYLNSPDIMEEKIKKKSTQQEKRVL